MALKLAAIPNRKASDAKIEGSKAKAELWLPLCPLIESGLNLLLEPSGQKSAQGWTGLKGRK